MRLGINYRKKKKTAKNPNTWRLNNKFLSNKKVTEEIMELNRLLETNDK